MTGSLATSLELPCGAVLSNRLAKAAMTEGLGTPDGRPTPELERLYGIWSDGPGELDNRQATGLHAQWREGEACWVQTDADGRRFECMVPAEHAELFGKRLSNELNSASAAEWEVRVDLAAMFRLTQMFGWDDTVWNHITARVPGTDHTFLMHRFGLLYEEVTASNLIKVDENGKVLEGPPDVNTAGFVIHSAIHLHHPHNKFVFHAHPPSALAATSEAARWGR